MPVCFAAGTPILLADGTIKLIEQIERGERVRGAFHDDPEGAISEGGVVEVYHHALRKLVQVEIGGDVIRVTPKHPFYVRGRGWTAAAELRPGDPLRTPSGSLIAVSSVVDNGQVEPVYNIQVAGLHTYFVRTCGGNVDVLVHNDSDIVVAGPSKTKEDTLTTSDWFEKFVWIPLQRNGGTKNSRDDLERCFFSGCIGLATLTTAGQYYPIDPTTGKALQHALPDLRKGFDEFDQAIAYRERA